MMLYPCRSPSASDNKMWNIAGVSGNISSGSCPSPFIFSLPLKNYTHIGNSRCGYTTMVWTSCQAFILFRPSQRHDRIQPRCPYRRVEAKDHSHCPGDGERQRSEERRVGKESRC